MVGACPGTRTEGAAGIRRACVLALSLFLAAAAHAQGRPDTYARVTKGHWAYRAVTRLEQRGYFTGSPEGTFDGRRELTRYEFAVAVERMYRGLSSRVLAASEPGQLPQEIRDFRLLLAEFGEDLTALGTDVRDMRRQVQILDQRVARLAALQAPGPLVSAADSGARPRSFTDPLAGLMAGSGALRSPLVPAIGSLPDPSATAGARLGPAALQVQVGAPAGLTATDRLPFHDPSLLYNFRAQLSLPLGAYRLSAFYSRLGMMEDRFRWWNPYLSLGGAEGVGGAFTGSLGDRLAFQFETSTLRPADDELTQLLYFRGGFKYALGHGFSVGLDYERMRQLGMPGGMDFTAYTMGIGRTLGRNARLEILLRHLIPDSGAGQATTSADLSNSSAITQFSIRF